MKGVLIYIYNLDSVHSTNEYNHQYQHKVIKYTWNGFIIII